jgi:type 1 glutamine amidotransferase
MFTRIRRFSVQGVMAAWLCTVATTARALDDECAIPPADQIPVLILSDSNPRRPGATTSDLKSVLAGSRRFAVSVCESTDGLSAATFAPFKLVVVDTGLTQGSETQRALAAWVAAGNGLVVARRALGAPGAPVDWPLAAGGTGRRVGFLEVSFAHPDQPHPILRGMADRFRMADALPEELAARPGADIIAAIPQGSRTIPVVALSMLGQGRIVALGLGSDAAAMYEPQFRALFARASEWAACGAVTLPAALDLSRSAAGAVRALLVTGGHDHDAAFYALFHRHAAIGGLPVDTAANAFKQDVHDKYDVIIMYDFTRALDAAGKKNLRDFVESGKGIVVLHHALLNYQDWTWWSEEVVGGRYRLRREGESPASSVKDGQQFDVTPVSTHPVLDGVNAFRIVDEAYKNLYQSPRIRPLLTTDNPASDTNLAWIGPCATSRVVAIQLGHGPSAFSHPSYQALVYNAVLWAAGHPAFQDRALPARNPR